jgi:hypothetical protein
MLARPKPVAFDPYGRRRSRRLLPPWAWWLLAGTAIGVALVLLVQERYLPPRLSAQASAALRASFERAETERGRLHTQLGDTTKRLELALSQKNGLERELAARSETMEQLRKDVASLVDSLPPDPRGGTVEVRAARFVVERGLLAYDVVLSRERAGAKPLTGVMQLVLTGDSARRSNDTVTLTPIAISVGSYDTLRGSLPLPEGFKPRQTTIHLLDRVDGKRLGMRVVHVK